MNIDSSETRTTSNCPVRLELVRREDDLVANEAAVKPYRSPPPVAAPPPARPRPRTPHTQRMNGWPTRTTTMTTKQLIDQLHRTHDDEVGAILHAHLVRPATTPGERTAASQSEPNATKFLSVN